MRRIVCFQFHFPLALLPLPVASSSVKQGHVQDARKTNWTRKREKEGRVFLALSCVLRGKYELLYFKPFLPYILSRGYTLGLKN